MKKLLDNISKAPASSVVGVMIIMMSIILYSFKIMNESVLIFIVGGAYGLLGDAFKEKKKDCNQIDNTQNDQSV